MGEKKEDYVEFFKDIFREAQAGGYDEDDEFDGDVELEENSDIETFIENLFEQSEVQSMDVSEGGFEESDVQSTWNKIKSGLEYDPDSDQLLSDGRVIENNFLGDD